MTSRANPSNLSAKLLAIASAQQNFLQMCEAFHGEINLPNKVRRESSPPNLMAKTVLVVTLPWLTLLKLACFDFLSAFSWTLAAGCER